MMQQRLVKIDARPHLQQRQVHDNPARFKVLACGRRWGKTRLGVNECLDVASRGGRAWWVAPNYRMSEVGWRPLRQMGQKIGAEVRLSDREVNLPGGGTVAVRSADAPDTLRGEGLDFVVVDECAFVAEEAWTESLRPALSDRKGKAMFISTPKGRNWFWRAWQTQGPEWASWQFPTSGNPYIDPGEIEAARKMLPERVFLQEYMAQFMESGGGVLRRVREAATLGPGSPEDGHDYTFGVDWGRDNDFTAITVWDGPRLGWPARMLALDRFTGIDYALQVGRLKALVDRWHPHNIVAESNSMGQPLIDMLGHEGLPIMPFVTTNASKAQIIDGLALALERGEIILQDDPVLVGEMQAYEMETLPSGLIRYSAPAGMHDDTVMSTAIGFWGVSNSGPLLLWGD